MNHMYRKWNESKGSFESFELPINSELYIGRVDINGHPAFEGDIIEFISLFGDLDPGNAQDNIVKGVIKVLKGRACVIVKFPDGTQEPYRFWFDGEHEWYSMEQLYSFVIIGNIQQNPELLVTHPKLRGL